MAKKILLVGNGAREHVIAETLKRSRHEVELYVVGKAKNPGLVELATEYLIGDLCDCDLVCGFAERVGVDFAVIGPENPIAAGVVDALETVGVKSASPLQTVGRLESSKGFTRDLLAKYGIEGNPQFKVFESGADESALDDELRAFLEELWNDGAGGFVVKDDGLKGGKGVKVSGDHLDGVEEGLAYAQECLADSGRVVVEEKFIGQEFSLMSFCDGAMTVEMPCIQDHKRAYDGDKGPNTGGMGTYGGPNGSLPFLEASDVEAAAEITRKVAKALKEETGVEFKGVMYGGFIATKSGVSLIEYNARFGDPEVMNVLPLLKSDFVDLCEAIIEGRLGEMDVEFDDSATVCRYVVPEGYPENSVKGEKIELGEVSEGVSVYYASVDGREDGLYLCGSRAVAFVGRGASIEEAGALVGRAVEGVSGPVFYRTDIGSEELIGKRVEMMKGLRG